MSTETWFYNPITVDRRELVPPPGGEYFEFTSRDGTILGAWWVPSTRKPSKGAVLYLHGNYGNIKTQWFQAAYLPDMGYDVLAMDWRGFGASQGKATRKGLWLDAQGGLDELGRRAPDSKRFVLGHSLGGAYAVRLSRHSRFSGAVALAGFISHQKIGADSLEKGGCPPILSGILAWFLVPSRFEPLGNGSKEASPLLIVHGDKDPKVPFWMGENLSRLEKASRFLPMPGYGHERYHEGPLGPSYLDALASFFRKNSI